MSKKGIKCFTVVLCTGILLLVWQLGRVSGNYLASQQDARMEEWVAGNASIGGKYAYLTFDDGPSEQTDKILDILKEEQVKATFFVVAKPGEMSRKRYQRIVEEGHTLGMHSFSHDYKKIYASVEAFSEDIRKLDSFLYDITGMHTKMFRFPGGSSNSIVDDMRPYIQFIKEEGYEYYDWNAVSGDAIDFHVSPQKLNQNILKDIHGQSPVIILMHDLTQASHTVEALPALIDTLKEQGYQLRAISKSTEAIHHVSLEEQKEY